MKKLTILFLFCCLNFFESFSQNFEWVRQVKGADDSRELGSFIEVDNYGNSYTLGISHSLEYDINPTTDGIQIINNQNSLISHPIDIYLIKSDENGAFIWGKSLSILKKDDYVFDMKLDTQGNIYILAYISEQYQNSIVSYNNGISYGFMSIIKIEPNGNEIYRHKLQNIASNVFGQIHPIASFDIDSVGNILIEMCFLRF